MKHSLQLVLLCLCVSNVIKAQFYETINSSRPGQSISAYTVGQSIFQLQSGVDHFGYTNDNDGSKAKGYLTNTALRYGLTESFEVGAFFEYKSEDVTVNNVTTTYSGLSNLAIGIRHQISVGNGIIPSVGFQFRVNLPVLSDYYKINNVAPNFVFITSQKLSKSFTLVTNLGGSWNGMDASASGTYTINLSWTLTDAFAVFVENYGSIKEGTFNTRMDTGVAWLVTRNLQLDLLGGYGSNHGLNDYFISTGVSWRTTRAKGPS